MNKGLPDNVSELTPADIQLLREAMRAAAGLPRFMNDPKASFRLGWIVGMLAREVRKESVE